MPPPWNGDRLGFHTFLIRSSMTTAVHLPSHSRKLIHPLTFIVLKSHPQTHCSHPAALPW